MGRTRMDPRKQFSKWLAKSSSVFWIIFLLVLVGLMCYRPETSLQCVYLAIIVTVDKIFNAWAYTKNSTYEKGLLAILDKTKMELTLKNGGKAGTSDDIDEEEGESNG